MKELIDLVVRAYGLIHTEKADLLLVGIQPIGGRYRMVVQKVGGLVAYMSEVCDRPEAAMKDLLFVMMKGLQDRRDVIGRDLEEVDDCIRALRGESLGV